MPVAFHTVPVWVYLQNPKSAFTVVVPAKGHVITGFWVSVIVICWTHEFVFPLSSTTVHVILLVPITNKFGALLVTNKVFIQLSEITGVPIFKFEVVYPQILVSLPFVKLEGHIIEGAVLSSIIITWLTKIWFPQSSVTEYILVIVSGLKFPSLDWETKATIGLAVQLSASSITTVGFGAGTSSIHSKLTVAGFEAVG